MAILVCVFKDHLAKFSFLIQFDGCIKGFFHVFCTPHIPCLFLLCYFYITCTAPVNVPGLDIYGQKVEKAASESFPCNNCQQTVVASRFAPHLEKCMGMGRNSSRLARRYIYIYVIYTCICINSCILSTSVFPFNISIELHIYIHINICILSMFGFFLLTFLLTFIYIKGNMLSLTATVAVHIYIYINTRRGHNVLSMSFFFFF